LRRAEGIPLFLRQLLARRRRSGVAFRFKACSIDMPQPLNARLGARMSGAGNGEVRVEGGTPTRAANAHTEQPARAAAPLKRAAARAAPRRVQVVPTLERRTVGRVRRRPVAARR
jgi:hypothetical protein